MNFDIRPQTPGQNLFLSFCMCFIMVTGMMTFNMGIHRSLTWMNLSRSFAPVFCAAFLVDYIAINRLTRRIVQRIMRNAQKRSLANWLFPVVKVSGMVLCMSCLAMLIEIGVTPDFQNDYASALLRNYPTALVLQLIIAGPTARLMLKILQERTN